MTLSRASPGKLGIGALEPYELVLPRLGTSLCSEDSPVAPMAADAIEDLERLGGGAPEEAKAAPLRPLLADLVAGVGGG